MNDYRQKGFTLIEIMLVIVIITILAAVALPRFAGSSDKARENADIITGTEVKAALDRYQIENGVYPSLGELSAAGGKVTGEKFIPAYIKRLDHTVTQQAAEQDKKGFGIAALTGGTDYPQPTNLIMIYLTSDGSDAEVKVFDKKFSRVLWGSE